ncbi:MAG TPA: 30S ribosomal protein S6 [Nitrolancea sp.]
MREYQRAPRGYELMALINPEITDEALTAAVDTVTGLITTFGGEISLIKRDTPWGRRRLAYPIQRFRDATYVLYQFMASPSSISPIERDLKLDERVIRYLLVRQDTPEVPEAPEEEAGEGVESSEAPAVEALAARNGTDEEAAEPAAGDDDVETTESEPEPESE